MSRFARGMYQGEVSKAEMVRSAFRKLGMNATTTQIKDYVMERYGKEVPQSAVNQGKKQVRDEQEVNGHFKPRIPVEVVIEREEVMEEEEAPQVQVDFAFSVLDVVKLTKSAIQAAGGKDNLKALIELL